MLCSFTSSLTEMSERGEVFVFASMNPVLIFNCDDQFSFAIHY